ncbi:hypothetical protein [Lederbergia citri]|uniref:Uncharacterized protein n=1 Tax=Lederbergia citri TaxID=2833580 RepID=A0A942TFM8_9BACI|nr:hypothetical protein [Lederbergia citri]MBS4197070.1 hypothetical protein [Lederbergia citri]
MEFNNSENVEKTSTGKKPPITEVIKAMSPEELEAFKRERYKKFIKPFLDRDDSRVFKKNKT